MHLLIIVFVYFWQLQLLFCVSRRVQHKIRHSVLVCKLGFHSLLASGCPPWARGCQRRAQTILLVKLGGWGPLEQAV